MNRRRRHTLALLGLAVVVVLLLVGYGVLAVRVRAVDFQARFGEPGWTPDELRAYTMEWPRQICGGLLLVWAATRGLSRRGSSLARAPMILGLALVAAGASGWVYLVAPGWAGPYTVADAPLGVGSRSFWLAAAGVLVVGASVVATWWLGRVPSPGHRPSATALAESCALVAVPVLTLGIVVLARAAADGAGWWLVSPALGFLLVVGAGLAASGGGRSALAAVALGLVLRSAADGFWTLDELLTVLAAGCALTLVPTARGIDWLTESRGGPTPAPASVPEGSDAHDRARA